MTDSQILTFRYLKEKKIICDFSVRFPYTVSWEDLSAHIDILRCLQRDQGARTHQLYINIFSLQQENNWQLNKNTMQTLCFILRNPSKMFLSLNQCEENMLPLCNILEYLMPSSWLHIRECLESIAGNLISLHKIKRHTRTTEKKSFLSLLKCLKDTQKYLDVFVFLNRDKKLNQHFLSTYYIEQRTDVHIRELNSIRCRKDVEMLIRAYESKLCRI